jgi:hypothetical protein
MALHHLFLDSNVFIGYAIDSEYIEPHHSVCEYLFCTSNCRKYTSSTVEEELKKKIRDRNRLYSQLLAFIISNDISQFNPPISNDNDILHIKAIKQGAANGKFDLYYVRTLGALLTRGIHDGLSRVDPPFVHRTSDEGMVDVLEAIGLHYPDSQIVADYCSWISARENGSLVTADRVIYESRVGIFEYLENERFWDITGKSIIHISNASRL